MSESIEETVSSGIRTSQLRTIVDVFVSESDFPCFPTRGTKVDIVVYTIPQCMFMYCSHMQKSMPDYGSVHIRVKCCSGKCMHHDGQYDLYC